MGRMTAPPKGLLKIVDNVCMQTHGIVRANRYFAYGKWATGQENRMYGVNLKNMDVDALLELRGGVDRRLTERQRDLQRQLGLLGKGITQVGRPVAPAGS